MAAIKAIACGVLLLCSCLLGGANSNINGKCTYVQFDELKAELSESKSAAVIRVAKSQIGVRELSGQNDGDQVEKYLRSVGLGKGYAWCAAFVSWVYDQADVEGVRSAWSPAWFPESKTVKEAIPGDTFGIYFRSKKRIAHVGLIERWGETVITIEGNTNDAGSREGDGVYRKRRLAKQIYKVSRWVD